MDALSTVLSVTCVAITEEFQTENESPFSFVQTIVHL